MEEVKKTLKEDELQQTAGGSVIIEGIRETDEVIVDAAEKPKDWFEEAPQKDVKGKTIIHVVPDKIVPV